MSSPAGDVMEILGHSQIALTMNTYSHVAPEVSREAADRMARALWHDEDQRMTTVAARVAARPVTGTPEPSPGVALTWGFTGEVFTFRPELGKGRLAGLPPTG